MWLPGIAEISQFYLVFFAGFYNIINVGPS